MSQRVVKQVLVLLAFLISLCFSLMACVAARIPEPAIRSALLNEANKKQDLVVLIDDELSLYRDIITGIHVASEGNYRILRLLDEGFVQAALLEQLIAIKPKALITIGPRAANAVVSARVFLPSVFSMVPRMENYELDNVFVAGIRMVPDLEEQLYLVRSLLPNLRSLGVMFSRQNSRNAIQRVRSLCDDEQFALVNIEVQSISDVLPALMRYHSEFDALLMLDDPLLLDNEAIHNLIDFLRSKGIALFALDCSMVEEGALASFGADFFAMGKDLVNLVLRKNNMRLYQPTTYLDPSKAELCVNLKTAEKMNKAEEILLHAMEYAADKDRTLKVYK